MEGKDQPKISPTIFGLTIAKILKNLIETGFELSLQHLVWDPIRAKKDLARKLYPAHFNIKFLCTTDGEVEVRWQTNEKR